MGQLAGWAYRKAITVNHTDDGAQTNYQMKVTLVKGAGVDATGIIYLNNHCLNWPTDILFTLSDGTTAVDFWREESDATDGTFWIKCPSIPAGGTWTGYIYYGDADAADASNGDNTFDFFDHFPGVALDTATKWTVLYGTPTVASSICQLKVAGGQRVDIITKAEWGNNHAIRTRLKSKHFHGAADYYEDGGFCNHENNKLNIAQYSHNTETTNGSYHSYDGASTITHITGWVADTYSIQDFIRNGTTNVVFQVDNANAITHTTNISTAEAMSILWQVYNYNDSELDIDWCLVRHCTLNEPTWAASGAEEALGGSVRNKFLSIGQEHIRRIKFHKTLKLK